MPAYLNPTILRIFALGIASGFPWVLIGSILTLWLQDMGISRSSIGYAGAIFAAYSVNFVWSPLIDQIERPLLLSFGQRKSWIFLTQLVMVACCLFISSIDIATSGAAESASQQAIQLIILGCLGIALASATQDIAIDAFRIDSIPEQETERVSYAASAAIAGWHTGFYGLAGLALFAVDYWGMDWSSLYLCAIPVLLLLSIITVTATEPPARDREVSHRELKQQYLSHIVSRSSLRNLFNTLLILSPIVLALWSLAGAPGLRVTVTASAWYVPGSLLLGFALLICGLLLIRPLQNFEPAAATARQASIIDGLLTRLASAVVHPLTDFFRRNGSQLAWMLLAFIVLFKLGEAFLGRMSLVFYKEVGFSNEEIALYSKFVSWGVTVVFALVSGWVMAKFGLLRGLLIAGISMAASNLMFSAIAIVGPEQWLFALTVIVDGFTSAWSNVAFVAFLSSLCNRNFSATQYALLASLGTLGRTLFASSSGQLVDALNGNWALFFVLTAALVIPSLVLLLRLGRKQIFSH